MQAQEGARRNRLGGSPFGWWDVRMWADFRGAFAILSYDVNGRRSPAARVTGGAILQDWHEIFSLAGIQQVAWNGREIQKCSFHVSLSRCLCLLQRRRFANFSCSKLS